MLSFPNINHHQHFFTGTFSLSNDELYLENYIFDTVFIVSGLQRSGNHMFIKLIIESLPENVLFINDFNVNNIQEIFNINLHSSFIYQGHYLSKNINNLISINDLLNKKEIENIIITTEELPILQIEELYNNFKNKMYIFRKIYNFDVNFKKKFNKHAK
mgnify:CR=1 FL=1